jgi:hypothetical protein
VPGAVVAEVSSVDTSRGLVVDAPVQNEGNGWAGSGANPWHLDAQTESILFLTNESNQPARIGFSITANGVYYYLTQLKLNPHETRAINIRQLRDAQLADFKKNLIPAAATDGSVSWVRIDNVPVMGRLMVIERHNGLAASYDCCTCPCPNSYISIGVTPSNFNVAVGWAYSCTATAEYDDCNSNQYYYDETSNSTWSSSDASIASVDSGGGVTGLTSGSATISATYSDCTYDQSCTCFVAPSSGSSPATVQVPEYVLLLGGTCSSYTCPTGDGSTQIRQEFYKVLDTGGNPIKIAGLSVAESVSMTGDSCDLPQPSDSGTWTTDANGITTTPDYLFYCFPSGYSCGVTLSQTFSVSGTAVSVTAGLPSGPTGTHNVIQFNSSGGTGSCPTDTPTQ